VTADTPGYFMQSEGHNRQNKRGQALLLTIKTRVSPLQLVTYKSQWCTWTRSLGWSHSRSQSRRGSCMGEGRGSCKGTGEGAHYEIS